MEDRCSTSWFKFGIKFHFCCSVLWKLHSLCPWTTQTSLGALAREPMVDGFLLMAFRNAEKSDRHLKCTAWLTRPNALLLVGYREELAIHNLWLQKAQRYPERDSYALHVKLEHIRVIGATELEEIQRINRIHSIRPFEDFAALPEAAPIKDGQVTINGSATPN